MHYKLQFEGRHEIGCYITLTNSYCIVGRSKSSLVLDFLKEKLDMPIVETTIGGINVIGSQCVGNKNGLLLSSACTDHELQHIRNSLPEEIRVVRSTDKLNCLGNVIMCNDYVAFVNPAFQERHLIEEVLCIKANYISIGKHALVGTYGIINSKGMLVHASVTPEEVKELSELSSTRVIAGTINEGDEVLGSGIVVNDYICIVGSKTTSVEITVAENIFNLSEQPFDPREIVEEISFH